MSRGATAAHARARGVPLVGILHAHSIPSGWRSLGAGCLAKRTGPPMNRLFLVVAAATLFTTASTAQTFVACPDDGLSPLHAGFGTPYGWLSSTTGFRSQWIYDSSYFATFGVNGPCVIHRMRFDNLIDSSHAGGS